MKLDKYKSKMRLIVAARIRNGIKLPGDTVIAAQNIAKEMLEFRTGKSNNFKIS